MKLCVFWVISWLLGFVAGNAHQQYVIRNPFIHSKPPLKTRSLVTIDVISNDSLTPKEFNSKWHPFSKATLFRHNNNGDILKQVVHEPNIQELVNKANLTKLFGKEFSYSSFSISSNHRFILFETDKKKLWRHSFYARYYVVDLLLWKFVSCDKLSAPDSKVQLVEWNPGDNSDLAFVSLGDIYVYKNDFANLIRVTFDGSLNVMNGVPDWVYEEVFSGRTALKWSPDGLKLAFLRFDDILIPNYIISQYHFNQNLSYPENVYIPYPKVGAPNPIVSLHLYDMKHDKVSFIDLSATISNSEFKDFIINEFVWLTNTHDSLMTRVLSRSQDKAAFVLTKCKGSMYRSLVVRKEDALVRGAWIHDSKMTFIPGQESKGGAVTQNGYIDTVVYKNHYHLAYFASIDLSNRSRMLTSGNWDVVNGVAGYDKESQTIYFLSTIADSTQRHVLGVSLSNSTGEIFELTSTKETAYYDITFSPNGKCYALNYKGPLYPYTQLHCLHGKEEGELLESNQGLKDIADTLLTPVSEIISVKIEGQDFNVKIVYPLNFDRNCHQCYPVIFNPYGGPGSQSVSFVYSFGVHHLLASKGYVVVVVDGRGTGFKGEKFMTAVKGKLGFYEARDQISVARFMKENWPFVHPDKFAIFGSSFGGYLAAKVLELDSGMFTAAISKSPVSDWRFYDSVYTERYMGLLENNQQGYDNGAVTQMEGFKHASFFLVHGTADDNVHFQHAAFLLDKLIEAGVTKYKLRVYPDSDHGISYGKASSQFLMEMIEFFEESFLNKN